MLEDMEGFKLSYFTYPHLRALFLLAGLSQSRNMARSRRILWTPIGTDDLFAPQVCDNPRLKLRKYLDVLAGLVS